MQKFDAAYFIKKFEAIPEDQWQAGDFSNSSGTKKCALGHCGINWSINNKEGNTLERLVKSSLNLNVASINDGTGIASTDQEKASESELLLLGNTPKQRILAALELIEAGVVV